MLIKRDLKITGQITIYKDFTVSATYAAALSPARNPVENALCGSNSNLSPC
jgi:hypothetical protein